MEKNGKIYVAGHTGLVGSAIVRALKKNGYNNLLLPTHEELDLTRQQETEDFFKKERPEYVFVAAGLVGGIKANSESPADFFSINMEIAMNVMQAAHKYQVKKLLYLGSACQYPKECSQPMTEKFLLTGLPEVTNEGYALAKISGCRLCSYMKLQYGDNFISAIPANTYGINDCFDPQRSHVIPALIMKYHNAEKKKEPAVELWGTGKAKREFIEVDDLADGCVFLMNHYDGVEPVNMGTGEEHTIMEISEMIKKITGYKGEIVCNTSKPDGMMRRILDSTKLMNMGWTPQMSMEQGLQKLYGWYLDNRDR